MAIRHRHAFAGAVLVPVLLLAASSAFAQDATAYGNETDYDAAAGASDFCLDFNGSSGALVSGASFSDAVTFGSPEATDPTQVNWSSDAISDAGSTTALNAVGPMDGTFTATAMAFKLTFSSNGTPATVDLYAEDATLIASLTAPNAPGFCGVVSTKPIKRFVLTPGKLADGNPDRFFVDDFCVTAEVAAPPPPPPPEPEPGSDLSTKCADLAAAIAAADPAAFRGRNRQHALANKMRVVCRRVDAGDAESLWAARQKLQHDILRKTDGDRGPKDWVTDATLQQSLEDQINALITALDDAIAAAGGHAGGSDDGDDGDDGGGGGGGGWGHANEHAGGHAK